MEHFKKIRDFFGGNTKAVVKEQNLTREVPEDEEDGPGAYRSSGSVDTATETEGSLRGR